MIMKCYGNQNQGNDTQTFKNNQITVRAYFLLGVLNPSCTVPHTSWFLRNDLVDLVMSQNQQSTYKNTVLVDPCLVCETSWSLPGGEKQRGGCVHSREGDVLPPLIPLSLRSSVCQLVHLSVCLPLRG